MEVLLLCMLFLHYYVRKVTGGDPYLLLANDKNVKLYFLRTRAARTFNEWSGKAVGLDFHYKTRTVYWSDFAESRIYKKEIELDPRLERSAQIVVDNVKTPEGLAVDWIYGNLYWTDAQTKSISVATLDGKWKRTLIDTNLQKPRAIVVDPRNGWMYWSDWGTKMIEKAGLDGSYRGIMIRGRLQWPNGLAIDYKDDKLYWLDSGIRYIGVCGLDGRGRRELVSLSEDTTSRYTFGLAMFQDYLYWTDQSKKNIQRARVERRGQSIKSHAFINNLHNPLGLKIFKETQQMPGMNYCKQDNAGCSHLCLAAPQLTSSSTKYTCACPDNVAMGQDRRTCASEDSDQAKISDVTTVPGGTRKSHGLSNVFYASVGGAAGFVLFFLLTLVSWCLCCRRRSCCKYRSEVAEVPGIKSIEPLSKVRGDETLRYREDREVQRMSFRASQKSLRGRGSIDRGLSNSNPSFLQTPHVHSLPDLGDQSGTPGVYSYVYSGFVFPNRSPPKSPVYASAYLEPDCVDQYQNVKPEVHSSCPYQNLTQCSRF